MVGAGTSKQVCLFVLLWIFVALLVLLSPAPREWGALGHWISPYYDRIDDFIEPAVHIALMATMAMVCMHYFNRRHALAAVSISFVLVMLAAAFLEGLQSLLPRNFARRCDVEDLVPAAVGAALGCLIALAARMLKSRGCNRR